jgi:cell division cycle protein 20 (cofactor of APC complex)
LARPARGPPPTPAPGLPAAQLDRFIPNRAALDFDGHSHFSLKENAAADDGASPSKDEYKKLLAASMNVGDASRILAFKHKAPAPPVGHENNLASLYTNNMGQAPARKHFRHVLATQERILDAPDIVDDYYLNLLDWSSQNLVGGGNAIPRPSPAVVARPLAAVDGRDLIASLVFPARAPAVGRAPAALGGALTARGSPVPELARHFAVPPDSELPHKPTPNHPPAQIAIALGRSVYLWNAGSGSVEELCEAPTEGDYISSVQWASDGSHLAVGTSDARVQIWDVARMKQVRELAGHTNRVSSLSWNTSILSSGGRDSVVCNWDVRKRKDEACVATLRHHEQEVRRRRCLGLGRCRCLGLGRCLRDSRPPPPKTPARLPLPEPNTRARTHPAGLRPQVVPVRPAAGVRLKRQLPVHLRRQVPAAAQGRRPHRRRQGPGLVPLPVQPAGHRRRHSRPLHPLLEHPDRRPAQQHRHRQPGVRAAVEPPRARDPEQPRVQQEPAVPVEVPLHGQGGGDDRPHGQGAAHGAEPRRHPGGARRWWPSACCRAALPPCCLACCVT